MNAASRVDDYISLLPGWQQAICQQVRQLVHDADPEVEETIKRSVLPYFVIQRNVCALLAAKDHVNVFIYDPTVPDPDGIINQGHGNATARALQGLPRRPDRPARTAGDIPSRHREQPRGRLATHPGITPLSPGSFPRPRTGPRRNRRKRRDPGMRDSPAARPVDTVEAAANRELRREQARALW